jgi:hypothetical protein
VPAGGYQRLSISEIGLDLDGRRGDELWMIESDASGRPRRFVDHVRFGPTLPGLTVGPWAGASETLVALAEPTLGAPNSDVRISEIVISEIHNSPVDPDGSDRLRAEDFQFVELYNRTDSPVELAGWRLSGSVGIDFVAGTVVPPRQTLVVVPFGTSSNTQEAVFRFHFGLDSSAQLVGPFDGMLPGDEGTLRLERVLGGIDAQSSDEYFAVMDWVPYQDSPPWPGESGIGQSLSRMPVDGFGPEPATWRRTQSSPGTVEALATLIGDSNADGVFDRKDIVRVLQSAKYRTGLPATLSEGDWNADGLFDQIDIVFALEAGTFVRGD